MEKKVGSKDQGKPDISQLTEVQKGVMRDKSWRDKYNKMYISEALETVQHGLSALAARLKRYTREAEAKRITDLFSKDLFRYTPSYRREQQQKD